MGTSSSKKNTITVLPATESWSTLDAFVTSETEKGTRKKTIAVSQDGAVEVRTRLNYSGDKEVEKPMKLDLHLKKSRTYNTLQTSIPDATHKDTTSKL